MDFKNWFDYGVESYRAYLRGMKLGCEPKAYGMAIQGKRKKKKKRK